jgi:putative Mn2+ efflux pump MntP
VLCSTAHLTSALTCFPASSSLLSLSHFRVLATLFTDLTFTNQSTAHPQPSAAAAADSAAQKENSRDHIHLQHMALAAKFDSAVVVVVVVFVAASIAAAEVVVAAFAEVLVKAGLATVPGLASHIVGSAMRRQVE